MTVPPERYELLKDRLVCGPRLYCYDAYHEHRHSGEHGHSGGAVLPASDRIVSTNLVRAAAVTPRLAGNRYGG